MANNTVHAESIRYGSPSARETALVGANGSRRAGLAGRTVSGLVVAALALAAASPGKAATLTYDFNGLATAGTFSGCSGGAYGTSSGNDAAGTVATNGLGAGVTVNGAVATKWYSAECRVVGETLGSSDWNSGTSAITHHAVNGGSLYDVFLRNVGGEPATGNHAWGIDGTDKITMVFTSYLYHVEFDYEIFPDATCPSLSNCGGTGYPNLPDLEFWAGVHLAAAPIFSQQWFGAAPAAGKPPQLLGKL